MENFKKNLTAVCRVIVRSMLWCDRFVWKRYLNVETPLYKLYWQNHSQAMQKKLDKVNEYKLSKLRPAYVKVSH